MKREGTLSGRLVAMPSSGFGDTINERDPGSALTRNYLSNAIYIEFPAMPETLEMNRTATYTEQAAPCIPDGIHLYEKTNPLHIPFKFRLHSGDDGYNSQFGINTLLVVASRLHAMILPIDTRGASFSVKSGWKYMNDDNTQTQSSVPAVDVLHGVGEDDARQSVVAPVVCQLELMYTGYNTPGIVCRGYLMNVGVTLNGPWLRTETGWNVPTSADYSFTFVHRPGHFNIWNNVAGAAVSNPQAYAGRVLERFYDTFGMAKQVAYQGLGASATVETALVPAVPAGSSVPEANRARTTP